MVTQGPHEAPTLISPASPRTINSMFGEFQGADPVVRMHSDDAAARGLADGAAVRVFNDRAELATTLTVDDDLLPGVVAMPKGLWRRALPGGLTANAFVPDTLSDLAGGACFNDAASTSPLSNLAPWPPGTGTRRLRTGPSSS